MTSDHSRANFDARDLSEHFQRWRDAAAGWERTGDLADRFEVAQQILRTTPRCGQLNVLELNVVARTVGALATQFFEQKCDHDSLQPTWSSGRRKVIFALATICASHTQPGLSLAFVAGRVAASRFTLSRLLKQETGRRFEVHVHTCRLLHAIRLLPSQLSIKEVAAKVGYAQTSDLDRSFGRYLHMTPGQFRALQPTSSESMVRITA